MTSVHQTAKINPSLVTQHHNDYMTPKYAWDNIKHLIGSKYKVIYESAYGDGNSGKYLKEIFPNKTIIHKNSDYFKREILEYGIEISNPPFSLSKEWLTEAKARGKPFMFILPTSKLGTQYFRGLFSEQGIQIIIPRKRIHFTKLVNGVMPENWKNACCFDCFYYTWKMDLPQDIIWLNN